jgi:nucleoside-diphosphate-sugar epimerase
MKILITGGAGYLGTVLSSHLLESGHRVRAFDSLLHGGRPLLALLGRDGFEFVRGDVRDAEAVRDALEGVDGVVHLAAIVGDPACAKQPDLARAVNLHASLGLFEAARAALVKRFVFASTCSNYGRMRDPGALANEDSELRPLSLYAETKVAVERHLLGQPAGGPTVTVLRFATLYGLSPRMRFDLTVNEFTMALALRKELTVYGEQFWRPYVHVRDAARAVALVLGSEPSLVERQVFNVGSTDENYRKQDLVALLREHVGEGRIAFVTKAEDPRDYRVSFERIAERLGYRTTRRVVDGIREIAGAIGCGAVGDASDPGFYNVEPGP